MDLPEPILPLPPPDMTVAQDHEGLAWRFGQDPAVAAMAGLFAASLAVAGALGAAAGLRGMLALLLVALLPLWVAIFAMRRTTIRLTSRALRVQGRGSERQDLRLDDLVEAKCSQSSRGDWALVVRTRNETAVLGARQPEEHLRWMALAIEHAIRRSGHREAVDGREWNFLRRAPEEISRLREPE